MQPIHDFVDYSIKAVEHAVSHFRFLKAIKIITRSIFTFLILGKILLNLEKEAQLRSYDGMIGHITITIVRYIFQALEQRCHDDPKTIGDLCFARSNEMEDLSLTESFT
jgi:hypothetical protein